MVNVEVSALGEESFWSKRVRVAFPDGYDILDVFSVLKGYIEPALAPILTAGAPDTFSASRSHAP